MRSWLRRLLPAVLAAAITAAIAVPVTWHLASGRSGGSGAELPDPPPGPQSREELRAELRAQLPPPQSGGLLLELPNQEPASFGLAPGDYEVHLICGLFRRQGVIEAADVVLRTPSLAWELTLPCPSTALLMDAVLQMSEPAGALVVRAGGEPSRPNSYLVMIRVVPRGGQAGADD